jgi:tRNA-specific 2-thiouridylase
MSNGVKKSKRKVLVALSGGIDSAVSAYLLIKQGYQVEAAFMKNWSSTEGLLKNECPWLNDRREALRAAAFLRIPLHTLNFEKQYQNRVMKYFFNEYHKGRTPNPDVMCNKEIKFGLLYDWAMSHRFGFLATGHYAQIRTTSPGLRPPSPHEGRGRGEVVYQLMRSADEFKDQTYFIYNIKPQQLPHLLFPIGNMKKTQVRSLARKIGLPNAERKESMGLCFVGKIRLKEFLSQRLKPKRGPIIFIPPLHPPLIKGGKRKNFPPYKGGESAEIPLLIKERLGEVIGQHEGLYQYTIGQRQGIKVGGSGPYYVFGKDLKANRLYVTDNPEDKRLFIKEVQIHSVNWIGQRGYGVEGRGKSKKSKTLNPKPLTLVGRFRHQGELVPLTIHQIKKDLYRVVFDQPQKAVASGQSLVLYKGKQCLGGGVIV